MSGEGTQIFFMFFRVCVGILYVRKEGGDDGALPKNFEITLVMSLATVEERRQRFTKGLRESRDNHTLAL